MHFDSARRKARRARQLANALSVPIEPLELREVELTPPEGCPSPEEIARMAAEIRAENDAASKGTPRGRGRKWRPGDAPDGPRESGIRVVRYTGNYRESW